MIDASTLQDIKKVLRWERIVYLPFLVGKIRLSYDCKVFFSKSDSSVEFFIWAWHPCKQKLQEDTNNLYCNSVNLWHLFYNNVNKFELWNLSSLFILVTYSFTLVLLMEGGREWGRERGSIALGKKKSR